MCQIQPVFRVGQIDEYVVRLVQGKMPLVKDSGTTHGTP